MLTTFACTLTKVTLPYLARLCVVDAVCLDPPLAVGVNIAPGQVMKALPGSTMRRVATTIASKS